MTAAEETGKKSKNSDRLAEPRRDSNVPDTDGSASPTGRARGGARQSLETVSQELRGAVGRAEGAMPGVLPVAIGAGALAVIGVVELPMAIGATILYGAVRWWRSDSSTARLRHHETIRGT